VVTKYIRAGVETLAAKKGSEKLFYHNDHLGGVNVITDKFGARCQLTEYDPWGAVSNQNGNCDPTHRFTGKELDPETGLYYYGGRYYDPILARFVSPDPFVSDPDPQNLNRYSYVLNNPINFIDPSGYFHRHKEDDDGGFFGAIFGAIFGFFSGGPFGAIIGAATGYGLSQLPPEVLHGMEIFGGIAMLLANNPMGLFFIAQGATGLCKQEGCQVASFMFGMVGNIGSVAEAASGGGSGGSSNSGNSGFLELGFKGRDIPSLGGFNGLPTGTAGAAKTAEGLFRRTGGDDGLFRGSGGAERCIDCSRFPVAGPVQQVGDTAGRDDIYFVGWREKAAKWVTDWKPLGPSEGFKKFGEGRAWGLVHRPTGLQVRMDYHPMEFGGPREWHLHLGGPTEATSGRIRIPGWLKK
jgi:RHS repeat-associated protein